MENNHLEPNFQVDKQSFAQPLSPAEAEVESDSQPVKDKKTLEERFFKPPSAAQTTFGRKVTPEEVKHKATLIDLLEKSWWILMLIVVMIIFFLNLPTLVSFLNTLFTPKEEISLTEGKEPLSAVFPATIEGSVYSLSTAESPDWLNPNLFSSLTYYQAGEFKEGKYKGGKRIIALAKEKGGEERVKDFIFVQMPSGEIFLDGGKPDPDTWLSRLQSFYLLEEVKSQEKGITLVDQLVSDHPETLKLSSTMLLHRRQLLTDLGPYSASKGEKLQISLDPASYESLPLLEAQNHPSLKFYRKNYNDQERNSQLAAGSQLADDLARTYLQSGTEVIVVDQTGLACVYDLIFSDRYDYYYKSVLEREILNLTLYQNQLAKYNATTQFQEFRQALARGEVVTDWPAGLPVAPVVSAKKPSFAYDGEADFEFKEEKPFFTGYQAAFLPACKIDSQTKVLRHVTKNDLAEIGKIFIPQASIYRLVDSNHPLYRLAFVSRWQNTDATEEEIISANRDLIYTINRYPKEEWYNYDSGYKKAQLPKEDDYSQALPLLLIEDPWGKILIIQENQLLTTQECLALATITEE